MSRKDYDNVIDLKNRRFRKKYSTFYNFIHKIYALFHIEASSSSKKNVV